MNILKKSELVFCEEFFLFATETCYISDVLHVLLPSNYLMFCYFGLWGYIGYIQNSWTSAPQERGLPSALTEYKEWLGGSVKTSHIWEDD